MKQWFIKTFKKKQAVIVYLVNEERRFRKYWVIPNSSGEVFVGNYAFVLNKDSMMLQNNIPTYVYNIKNADPINLTKKRTRHMTAEEFHLAIDNHVAQDIIKASGGDKLSLEFIITLLVMFIGFAGLFYVFNGQFEEIKLIIETLQSTTETVEPVIGG